MNKMTSDMDALAGRLNAPWGAQTAAPPLSVNQPVPQVSQVCQHPPQGECAHVGHGQQVWQVCQHPLQGERSHVRHHGCPHRAHPPQHPVRPGPALSAQPTLAQQGPGTHWIKADQSTPSIVRYKFPTNAGVLPPEDAGTRGSGESYWSQGPPETPSPEPIRGAVPQPLGESDWEPDMGLYDVDYDNDRGHEANLQDAIARD